ncbi:MAG: orotate phosphoribosyltransferase [bacterium]|nr:orotate phosphoribosyltransferase [bacterium]MBK7045307.1 orotate phosphoribosyltransferase [bacterium]MBK7672216.1 orotate phosphoribosyltransferase [bacterium]MBK7769074.1 orotate phosphoribosyltransferase [bacterium]MBK9775770.1 orotate phosphoribosyltransferase [bacterium]
MNESSLLSLMEELGALHKGHFLLSSGRHSHTYFQCARLLQFPELARELGAELATFFADVPHDVVVSPALGGILIGHEVARAVGRRFLFTERKESQMELRRGFTLEPREKVLIVEDVVTRGTSLLEVARVVEANGGVVVGLSCIVDRTGGEVELPLPLRSLARVAVETWEPADCPLCRAGKPVIKPGSRGN